MVLSTENTIAKILSTPHATTSFTFMCYKVVKLLMANLELFKGIVPLSVLTYSSSHTELLIIVYVHA